MKRICIVLTVFVLVQIIAISVYALDDRKESEPVTVKSADASLNMIFSVETAAEETEPPTTAPPETEPPETVAEITEEKIVSFNGVPLYFQTDYPDEEYDNGTIADSGCGITSLAMVATYMTGYEYTPDALADWFGNKGADNVERLEYASEALRLSYEGGLNYDETIAALREGKVAIVLMGEESIFTDNQHFIVLAGFTDDGKIMVLDPYEPNYDHWQLKRALKEGFDGSDILMGFSGGWAYDKEAMPEESFVYEDNFSFNGMPLYFQTDYPDEMYGSGTIANSGCGITSLAMVATYMTGHEYTPDELADWFGGKASNNIDRLEYASDALQLPYEGRLNYDETMAGLREGKVAIVLMESDSIFTESQHFIVLAGFTDNGNIMVLDPYEPNYDHWQLKRALKEGFNGGDILKGFSGGWVYDKEALPEEPFIYEEIKEEVEYRYEGIELTVEEKKLLAKMVWVEAQGEPLEGQQAVAEVVLNRLAADNFPDTLRGVIYADGQFRSVPKLDDARPNQTQYEAVEQALEGPYVLPKDVVFFATYAVNKNVWGQIGGHIFCYQWDSE